MLLESMHNIALTCKTCKKNCRLKCSELKYNQNRKFVLEDTSRPTSKTKDNTEVQELKYEKNRKASNH